MFVDTAERSGAAYKTLWEHMQAGQYEHGRFKRMGKNDTFVPY
jgi:hypothetical protein